MSEPIRRWSAVNDLILPRPSAGPAALLLEDAEGWHLPRVRIADLDSAGYLHRLRQELTRTLGVDAPVLRSAARRDDDEKLCMHMTYIFEAPSPDWRLPSHGRWVGRSGLGELAGLPPEQRAVLDAFLGEAEAGVVPDARAPWCRAGWLAEAGAWMADRLAELGTPVQGPIEQMRNWSISCILRAPTEAGWVYFKASADLPLLVNEPRVMEWLAGRYPALVPRPLAVDLARRWMLLADFGPSIGRSGPLAARERMLREFSRLQRDSAERAGELLGLGCLDRRLARLPAQADALLGDAAALEGLTGSEIERLRAELPRLRELGGALAGQGLPETLVHGDLHLNNVAAPEGGCCFFDWTDACVAHPFFDLISVFHEKDAAVRERLRDVYLEGWAGAAPRDRLLEAYSLAWPLAELHQAISYQHLLAGLEPDARSDFEGAVAYHLRQLLQALDFRAVP